MNKKSFSIGLCGKKQKEITKAIKRAQIMGKNIWKNELGWSKFCSFFVKNFIYLFTGFMPVTYKDPVYLKDLQVWNIKYQD